MYQIYNFKVPRGAILVWDASCFTMIFFMFLGDLNHLAFLKIKEKMLLNEKK